MTKTTSLLLALGALLATVPSAASASAVPPDVAGMAAQARSADPGAAAGTLASCWADSVHTARPRLQFCLAYEVAASGGTLAGPSIAGVSPVARVAAYFSRLGVPVEARKAELDRIRALVSPGSATASSTAAVEAYKGRLDGGRGTLSIARAMDGSVHVSIGVSGHGCAGQVDGTAHQEGAALSLLRAANGDECSLKITRGPGSATIVENRCPIFHGGSCDFNGTLHLAR